MSLKIFLSGNKVNLCLLDNNADLSEYLSWINDQKTTLYMDSGKYPQTLKHLREYIQRQYEQSNIFLGIFKRKDGKHIGNINLHSIDHHNRTAEIGIMIGNRKEQRKGYGSEALELIIFHGFMRLNLNKLCAGVVAENISSIKLFERTGFKLEGTLREHFYLNGVYHDALRYGLLRHEYKKKV